MRYEDLAVLHYLGQEQSTPIIAVGWLENGKPFTTGKINAKVYENLCEFRKNPWV